ncbi:putative glutamate carboxypeptidase AMP1, partial [Bienertia sinuspersici]
KNGTKICITIYKRPTTIIVFIVLLCIFGFYNFKSPFNHTKAKTQKLSKPTIHFHDTYLSLSSNYTVSEYLHSLTLHPHLAGTHEGYKTAQYRSGHRRNWVPEIVRPYHAYSPSGMAVGMAVYVNYGRKEDYHALGWGVREAEVRGAVAVLTFTEGVYVKGVERGTVMKGLGDPLSPGWGSLMEGGERLRRGDKEVENRFPKIPSMPISVETAQAILSSLEGPQLPQEWEDSLQIKVLRVGPGLLCSISLT